MAQPRPPERERLCAVVDDPRAVRESRLSRLVFSEIKTKVRMQEWNMRIEWMAWPAAVAGCMAAAGCEHRLNVQCIEDSNCDLQFGGACTLDPLGNHWCAYPDPLCPSGLRYSTPVTVTYDRRTATYPMSYVSIFYPAALDMEMGQGTMTSHAQILADELDVNPARFVI